jgi:hypothetical protein
LKLTGSSPRTTGSRQQTNAATAKIAAARQRRPGHEKREWLRAITALISPWHAEGGRCGCRQAG